MNSTNQNFLDSKTLLAIFLLVISWIGWEWYMQKKYPTRALPKPAAQVTPTNIENSALPVSSPTAPLEIKNTNKTVLAQVVEQNLNYSSEWLNFDISSLGMGLHEIKLNKFTERNKLVKRMAVNRRPYSFETGFFGGTHAIDFQLSQPSHDSFVGTADMDGMKVVKTVRVHPELYTLETEILVIHPKASFHGLTANIYDDLVAVEKKGLFAPAGEHQEFYIVTDNKSQRVPLSMDKPVAQSFSKNSIVALGSQYFVQGLINRGGVIPEIDLKSDVTEHEATASVKFPVLNIGDEFTVKYTSYIGPKSMALLKSVDDEFGSVINFGFFGFIGHYILKLMILFHDWCGNWGFAIIGLTVLVRALVLPFNVMSYKSMKAMQVIQPLLKELREKFKDDPQKLNVETIALMRTHKANPLGGCLPILLQLPIFWALYQVLGQSIELYQAPFIFWIRDLSLRDPYYVLPVLMGATLFVQQRLTPSTMDPAQKKIMAFMPLLFSFFMVSLPSGLTLYIFVSGLFGALQQYYFMRDRHKAVPATILE